MSYRNNRRGNNNNNNNNKPSKVLHVRNLPAYANEEELDKLCNPFGAVTKTFFLHGKQQAFVEMETNEQTQELVDHYSNNPSLIRNKRVYFQFSNRQEISSGAASSSIGYTASQKDQGIAPPSSILIVSVYNTLVPVTLENLHQIFKACGGVLKIITFVKNNIFKGLVQMGSVEDATASIAQLDGRDIFQGCCTLRIGYSTLPDLTIKANGPNSWDFTVAENVELSQNHYRQQMAQYHQYAANPPSYPPQSQGGPQQPPVQGNPPVQMQGQPQPQPNGQPQPQPSGEPQQPGEADDPSQQPLQQQPVPTLAQGQGLVQGQPMPMPITGQPAVNNGQHLPLQQLPLDADQGQMQSQYDSANLAMINQQAYVSNTQGYMAQQPQHSSFGWSPANGQQVDLKQSDLQQQHFGQQQQGGPLADPAQQMMQQQNYDYQQQQVQQQGRQNFQQHHPQQYPQQQQRGGYQIIANQQGPPQWNNGQQQLQQRQGYNPNNPNPPNSPVLVVNGLPSSWTIDQLFTLFGVYGVVIRIQLLPQQNCAMVQYATPFQANLALSNLQFIVLEGNEVHISFGKQAFIQPTAESDPNKGQCKDYTDSTLHRFKHHDSRNSKNIHPPSAVLHVSNLPQEIDEKFLGNLFKETETPNPQIQFFATDRRMAYVCMTNVHDGIMALVRCHNHNAYSRGLRVSFSHKNASQVLKHNFNQDR
jgi:RNA recognition motif-containing protein